MTKRLRKPKPKPKKEEAVQADETQTHQPTAEDLEVLLAEIDERLRQRRNP